MSQHTNKWGWVGYNCKMRPAGAGTTHSTRREQRKHLQWEAMAESHQADSEEALEKQVKALEKAAQKAQQKLQELKEKEKNAPLEKGDQDEEDEEEEEEYSYSYYSPSPAPARKRKGRSNTKSLEKDRSLSVRRTRIAKGGQKEALLFKVKEEATSSEVAPSKNDEKMEDKPLEKEKEALEKASTEAVQKDKQEEGEKDRKALEKATSSVVPDGITLTPAKKFLEEESKETLDSKEALEKASKITLKPRAQMPKRVVVVDWHQSLEKDDTVPESHQESLEKLLQVAEVHILSYVASRSRMVQVHQDVRRMVRSQAQLAGVHTCWQKVGWDGKAAYCQWLKAEAIFDDDEKICVDCFGKGICTFALMSGKSHHNYLPARNVFKDFPEAVQEYLDAIQA